MHPASGPATLAHALPLTCNINFMAFLALDLAVTVLRVQFLVVSALLRIALRATNLIKHLLFSF